jgi:DNA invertase Pin-like site-specific DNA recombinase
MSSLAKVEAEKIGERVKAGLARLARNGKTLGVRSSTPTQKRRLGDRWNEQGIQ